MRIHTLFTILLFLAIQTLGQNGLSRPELEAGVPSRVTLNRFNPSTVPFEFINDFIVIDMILNEQILLKFILDTGSEASIITQPEIIDMLGIPRGKVVKLYGADRKTILNAQILPIVQLKASNLNFENIPILLLQDNYFNTSTDIGVQIHGILGADILRRFIIEINPIDQTITFHKKLPNKQRLKKYTRINSDYDRGRFFTNIQINQNGKLKNERFLIDSGSNEAIVYHLDTIRDAQLATNLVPTAISQGLGGEIKGYTGFATSIELENLLIRNIPIQYQVLSYGDSLTSFRSGILGIPVLKQFNILMDYARGDVYLKKNKLFGSNIERDKSGISLIASGPNLNDFIITNVFPGSPAYHAGLKKDDRIISVKGVNNKLLGLSDINKKFKRKNGRRMRLKVKRGAETISVSFRLDDYLLKNFS
jgi:predicted aspartyl protease